MKRLALALLFAAKTASASEVHTSLRDVRACAVGDAGVVLATTGGVAWLDAKGETKRVLTALDGLPETKSSAVFLDGGDLWIGTERGAALVREGKVVRVVSDAKVRAFAKLGSDLYLGTWGEGVERVTANGVAKVPFAGAADKGRERVASLVAWNGALVAATAAGSFRLEPKGLVPLANAPHASTFALASKGDRLFLGSIEGLFALAPKGVVRASAADARALVFAGDTLFAGTFGEGLLRVFEGPSKGLDTKFVQALDAKGDTRCAGTPDGAFVAKGATWSAVARAGLPSVDVTAVAHDGKRLWVATFDRGLATIEGGVARAVTDAALDRRIDALAIEGPTVWMATPRGVSSLTNGVVRRFGEADGLPSSDVHALLPLAKGGLLVGTSKGAAIVRGNGVQPLGKKQGVASDAVWALAESGDELLLGTNAGLLIGKPGSKWTRLSTLSGHLNDDWITALAMKDGALFVGTYAHGVTKLVRTSTGWSSSHLGGGSVNPNGLRFVGEELHVATMEGLFVSKGGPLVASTRALLGRDVTAVLPTPSGLVIATRRGLSIG